MKKFFRYVAVAVLGMAFALPMAATVDAAKLAVVPLILSTKVKDDQGTKPLLFSEAVGKTFKYPEYDMADSDAIKKAALAQQDKLFTKEGMKAVCEATGSEIAIAMSVERFDWNENRQLRTPTTVCDFRGKFATYNVITGKYSFQNWHDDAEKETESYSVRVDWPHIEFGRYCKVLLEEAMKKK